MYNKSYFKEDPLTISYVDSTYDLAQNSKDSKDSNNNITKTFYKVLCIDH